MALPLACLFEMSMIQGRLPNVWKDAFVIPIFKKGLAKNSNNYRPVSLTCIPYKVMESIMYDEMLKYLRLHKLISADQFGFLSRRSTGLQLLATLNDWTAAMRDKKTNRLRVY